MKPGDRCQTEHCDGRLIVRTSKNCGVYQLRYLECNKCKEYGGKMMVHEKTIFRRKDASEK